MFSERWSLSLLSLFFQKDHGFGLTQAFCMIPLSYMVCTAYWSIFRLKVAGWYGLYPNHNTDTSSLLWCASMLARLAAPLCYHFLLLIRVKGTTFQAIMGQMNVVPVVGQSFNEIFPVLVFVLCLCNLLNLYSRLVQLFSLNTFEVKFDGALLHDKSETLAEGKRLIQYERLKCAEDAHFLDNHDGRDEGITIPLRLQIARLIQEGAFPKNWDAHSPGP